MMRLIVLLLFSAAAVFAQTMLWKVSKGNRTLYLGGTVHMLRSTDFPMPEAFERAFASSDTIVFETDMAALQTPAYVAQLRSQLMCGPGESLRALLSRQTYAALAAYAQRQGIPSEMLEQMKPPMAVMTLVTLKLQGMGMAAPGVDAYYYQKALKEGKTVRWFESPQVQTDMLASIGREDANGMVRETLESLDDYATVMPGIIDAWRRGDTGTLERFGKKYLMHDSPRDYRRLIVERNRRWLPTIRTMLGNRETELVLVGALHLVGPDGLVQMLRRKGYRVEQLP